MKKTFTILFLVGLAFSAAAQHGKQAGDEYNRKNDQTFAYGSMQHDKNDNKPQQHKQWGYNQQNNNEKDRHYSNIDHPFNGREQQMQERVRLEAIDRVNNDYDQRIDEYKNDRSMNNYERNRRIAAAQRERQQRIGSFGTGIFAGAIVELVAGALFAH